ncbi:hypothetical protein B0H16DRAFT_1499883 [Mycena metata]|uniref:Uncharacterized protein n=1 Tax=Mycena metata TaxID=1033252 RepID=A0AAD7K773_9AGAR|nr:hypothetical protein B0H16DRAFT_1499883 [Mycena metata]
MSGQYIRLTAPPATERHHGKAFAQFDPKTLYLVEGADPVALGRASSQRGSHRANDPDTGYLNVPTGQTALGRDHALLCVRNDCLYIAMKEHDGAILGAMLVELRLLSPHSEYYHIPSGSRIRLGVNGAVGVQLLVDIIVEISATDRWSATSRKRFIKGLPA